MQESFEDRYNPDLIQNLGADFISVECLEKLGLDENPFIDHARDPYLYVDHQLEMSINVLVDYLQNQNSTLVLLGEIGVGKTTQLRLLLRKGYQHFNFCTLRAKAKTTFSDIEEKIKERWHLPEQKELEQLANDVFISQYIDSGKHPVLIIDDAHRLESYTLDALLQLKHHVGLQSEKKLGLVLAAEPKIQTQLADLEHTNPAATHVYQINVRALNATQCEKYIQYRLTKARTNNLELFSTDNIAEIYTKSKGLPRNINKLAREALNKKCEHELKQKSATPSFRSNPILRLGVIAAGLFGLAILAAVLLNKNNQNSSESVELELSKTNDKQVNANQKVKSKDNKFEIETIATPLPNEAKVIHKPYVAPLVLGPLKHEQITNNQEKQATKEKSKQDKTQTKPVYDDQSQKIPLSSEWLLQQPPTSYTLQIVASPSQENLFAFAKKNMPNLQTAYYKKTAQNKTWYVLVHGIYPNREDALKELTSLPEELKKNSPYPQQIKHIQQTIRDLQ